MKGKGNDDDVGSLLQKQVGAQHVSLFLKVSRYYYLMYNNNIAMKI